MVVSSLKTELKAVNAPAASYFEPVAFKPIKSYSIAFEYLSGVSTISSAGYLSSPASMS
ncbi:MAG: hypothetical protein PUC70_02605 [bacterium]|nr:hypothetical protein [bacterium]